jgi:hypothetical protein
MEENALVLGLHETQQMSFAYTNPPLQWVDAVQGLANGALRFIDPRNCIKFFRVWSLPFISTDMS